MFANKITLSLFKSWKIVIKISITLIIFITILSAAACGFLKNNAKTPSASQTQTEAVFKVDKNGFFTRLNENGDRVTYVVKSVAWNVPNDYNGDVFGYYESYHKTISYLKELNANAARAYRLPIDFESVIYDERDGHYNIREVTLNWENTEEMLKAFAKAKIGIQAGLCSWDIQPVKITDEKGNVEYTTLAEAFIKRFDSKTNSLGVVLMYLTGNEFNYHFQDVIAFPDTGVDIFQGDKWFTRDAWLGDLKKVVDIVRSLSKTPVGTVHGEVPLEADAVEYVKLELDAVLLNIYRKGSDYDAIDQTRTVFKKIGGKMPYISFGEIGGNPYDVELAHAHADIFKKYPETGGSYFALYHKYDTDFNEDSGLIDTDGNKTPIFAIIQSAFKEMPASLTYNK
ncbi:MAG: hypothetical protein FWF00_00630 [Endomicrobia bacterium]|nr:hypothetical protein [Endomicrobiia bacterium]MCL2506182.1 hypothetical protein [Endomicrobiia bacterium]